MSEDINHTTSKRKTEHLNLTFKSQVETIHSDGRFSYEPILGSLNDVDLKTNIFGTRFDAPIWISSMTGGTGIAKNININLAKLCADYNLGMGLGSCRQLLDSDNNFADFNVRKYIGNRPLFANLGIAQIEQLLKEKKTIKIKELIDKLQADGLIIHINPLQEFTQSEGDRLEARPIDTLKRVLDIIDFKLIVKEVGQGMGYNSIKALLQLPLTAIEFAAFGGTNFTKLELLRNKNITSEQYISLINIGHSAEEMVDFVNLSKKELGNKLQCNEIIISGGIKSFLDGYYYTEKIELPAIYGMASEFLKFATGDYKELKEYMVKHIEGLKLANTFLKIKK